MNVLAKDNRTRKIRAQASVLTSLVLLVVTCFGVSNFSQVVRRTGLF